jgi:hypothetical protein
MVAGNAFLVTTFLSTLNGQFAVPAAVAKAAYRPVPHGWDTHRHCAFPDARRVAVTTPSAWRRCVCSCPHESSPIIRNVGGFSEISCVSHLNIREAFAAASTPTSCFKRIDTSSGHQKSGMALAMHLPHRKVCAWQREEWRCNTASVAMHAAASDRSRCERIFVSSRCNGVYHQGSSYSCQPGYGGPYFISSLS